MGALGGGGDGIVENAAGRGSVARNCGDRFETMDFSFPQSKRNSFVTLAPCAPLSS
jgi:hypothetical protein